MLVLTRRSGEEIVIGDEIRLTVVRVEGSKVRLGIVAPQTVSVRRVKSCAQPSRKLGDTLAQESVLLSDN